MKKLYDLGRNGKRLTKGYGQKLNFHGIGNHLTVYNATPPLWLRTHGRMTQVCAGRVEHREDWAHSRIMFFERQSATEYHLISGAPIFSGEDAAITTIGDEIIFSSVRCAATRGSAYLINTEIRRARDVTELWECWRTIPGKDNRITPIDDGTRIAVMPRPQGGAAGRGEMAYIELDSIDELSADSLRAAKPIVLPKSDDTWVGPNELHNLSKKNQIGILGHGAFEDGVSHMNGKNYFIFFAWLDRQTLTILDVIPLALREDFPSSIPKTPLLSNVAFGTGLMISDQQVELYAGVGDSVQAFVPIHNPKIVNLYN